MSNVTETSIPGPASRPPSDDGFDEFVTAVRQRFAATSAVDQGKPPALFTTESGDLFEVYLAALPAELRPVNACATCRRFFARYASLVTIDERGKVASALWTAGQGPAAYAAAANAVADVVRQAPITGVFVSSDPSWGVAEKGGWSHLSVSPKPVQLFPSDGVRTADQAAAERREDFRTLVAGLEAYPLTLVQRAASLLETGSLYRSEKCISVAKWLLELHRVRKSAKSARVRDNLTWRAVGSAPPGFCHVRSSMIATLLDDLAMELPFATIKSRFDAKMDPLQYQRPTAAPSAGNIERAEKVVAKLRSAGALERRFATLADIEPLWQPTPPAGRAEGVFGHLKPGAKPSSQPVDAPATVMTWEKFARTVLPTATQIHYNVPKAPQSYLGLVTAVHPDAPPILQWDNEARRNPVSWYVYVNGSVPQRWNLRAGDSHRVGAITLSPAMWGLGGSTNSHQGKMVLFVLDGAKDLDYQKGAGFFPEFLKSDYREIRSTIEAYTKEAIVAGKHEAQACGISLQQGVTWGHVFRVTDSHGLTREYQLDRWD